MTVQSGKLYCFGFGYVAARLADNLLGDGGTLCGTTRSPEKVKKISLLDDNSAGLFWKAGDPVEQLTDGCDILISVPPKNDGCPVFAVIKDKAAHAHSITYLSTTGVFGDHQGAWVTENTTVSPKTERAKRRVLAEEQWKTAGANIARLPGIYGPGRSAFDRLRAGTAKRIVKRGHVFSRCHVDDIVSGLIAIMNKTTDSRVFHLCDDEPAPPQEVIVYAAKLLGVCPPPQQSFERAQLSEMARSFYSECKRVSNALTKTALDWQPRYPSYREGLAAILEEETQR